MKEYDDKTLAHVQRLELMILKDFIHVCDEYDLTYFAYGGTGIGAFRHKGFIPWDDDIDVCLPVRDYKKLLSVFERDYSKTYTVMNAHKDPHYPLPTSRIMIKGTQFCEEALKDLPLDLGIFLDIYCLDNIPDDDKLFRKQARKAWFWSHMRLLKLIPKPFIVYHGFKGSLVRFVTYTAGWIISHMPLSLEYCLKKETEAHEQYADKKTGRIGYLCDTNPYNLVWTWEEVLPPVILPFEGFNVKFPANIDAHLRAFYGDYMQMPPVEQRKNHYPARLDFGSWK